jgi:hypothetical protein
MGIEPARSMLRKLENKGFEAISNPKCDGRGNFHGIWGHVGMREPIPVATDP